MEGTYAATGTGHDRPAGAIPGLNQNLGTTVVRTHCGAGTGREARHTKEVIVARPAVGAGHDRPGGGGCFERAKE